MIPAFFLALFWVGTGVAFAAEVAGRLSRGR
jgi:hypothetical protein